MQIDMRTLSRVSLAALLLSSGLAATEPTPATQRWWNHVRALANDGMEGRDTGSAGYLKAAQYVVTQFERFGVKPAGTNSYYQDVPLHVVRVRADLSRAELVRGGATRRLEWLRQIRVGVHTSVPPTVDAPMVFVGSPGWEREVDVAGKIVVQLNPPPNVERAPTAVLARAPEGAVGLLGIDNLASLEARRWPAQYLVAMRLREEPEAAYRGLVFALNPAAADTVFEGSGHTFREVKDLYDQGKRVPNFALPSRFRASIRVEEADLESPNIVGMIQGSDPALGHESLVLSAHLDGYGLGEPWGSDRIYNGAFDDAAYVAALLELSERIKERGITLRRSIVFAIFTGEEKGLLGSRYFTKHLPLPKERVVANVNLDQVRPLFPLTQLTLIGFNESTLDDTILSVAAKNGLRIQPDPEPWRNLIRRADNWNFMQIGVPAVGFVLAPRKGTMDEEAYQAWYAQRYHTPLDDLNQPWDPSAAAAFNTFFEHVVAELANRVERPAWRTGSVYAKPQ